MIRSAYEIGEDCITNCVLLDNLLLNTTCGAEWKEEDGVNLDEDNELTALAFSVYGTQKGTKRKQIWARFGEFLSTNIQ